METPCATGTSGSGSSRATTSHSGKRALIESVRRTRLFRAVGRVALRATVVEVTELDGDRGWKYRARIGPVESGSVSLVILRDAQDPLRGHWLMALSVRPAFRRIGVARLLCERVLRRSHELGSASVRLTVRQDNAPAIRLYESLGFARLDDIRGLESELKRLADLSGAPYIAMEAQTGESQ